ncbi:MAG: ATP-binding protein [Minwuia sp.]|nr:ATP-binding protein [Minwuia sp.]
MQTDDLAVSPDHLRRATDPASLGFSTTEELSDVVQNVTQERAIEAVSFGVGIQSPGYNVFVMGGPGHGRHRIVSSILKSLAAERPTPSDWCYVHNFQNPHKPRAIMLPPGRGTRLKADMDRLITELSAAVPGAFESDDYRARRQALDDGMQQRQQEMFAGIQAEAEKSGVALIRTPMGFTFAPAKDGEVLTPETFRALDQAERERIQAEIERLQGQLKSIVVQIPGIEKEHREKVRELDREVTRFAVGHLTDELEKTYADLPDVAAHIDAVEADIVENAGQFLRPAPSQNPPTDAEGGVEAAVRAIQRRYRANLIVNNGDTSGAPIVAEDFPSHGNVFGRIEHIAQFGALATDFNLILGGALHRANGGYLILDARQILTQPFAWEQLKRALRSREIRIESIAQSMGMISTVTLDPEPIPLDTKIVLVGDRQLYYLLSAHDPEFPDLFKIAADIEDQVPRREDTALQLSAIVATASRNEGLLPLDSGAMAGILDFAIRKAGDAERFSTQVGDMIDLAREANHMATAAGAPAISPAHVSAAQDARVRRGSRIRDQIYERIADDVVLVDVDGSTVGQVNGLSVLQAGALAFGQPSRITARVRMGRGGVMDIEREAKLGGALHTKGVMILQGFIAQHYLPELPLSLSASLVFEQSYGGVDGDSASMAELCALLSAISGLPIRQDLAMTGSVNQHGISQAIGGVNEKVEGFFDICSTAGLTGNQGVIIPRSNVRHLMLREDVVAAARAGTFHIHAISTVDEALSLLTGKPAGPRDADGTFADGTVHRMVEDRLTTYARASKAASSPDGQDHGQVENVV